MLINFWQTKKTSLFIALRFHFWFNKNFLSQTLVSSGQENNKFKDRPSASKPSNGAKIKPLGQTNHSSSTDFGKKNKLDVKKVRYTLYQMFNI